jgi:hypothetical protein
MQRKNWIIIGLIGVALCASSFLLPSKPAPVEEKSTCCQQPGSHCTEKSKGTGEVLPENLSHQFIFISPVAN